MAKNKQQVVTTPSPAAPQYVLRRSAHQRPKKQFTLGSMGINGQQYAVSVTGKPGGKWPQYTFVEVGGVYYYLHGNMAGQNITAALPPKRQPKAALPAEAQPTA